MNTYSKIILLAAIALAAIWIVHNYRLKSYGIAMIESGDIEELAKTVEGRPGLATQLLGDAYQANNQAMFEMLLKQGGDVNTAQLKTDWGPYPLLHHLARHGEATWLKVAFDNGGDPSRIGRNGITPLLEAIQGRRPDNAIVAIEAGADIHHRLKNEKSYFDIAVHEMQLDVAYQLLESGIDFNAGTYNEYASGIYRLQNMDKVAWSASKERELKAIEWHSKIVKWFREHDLDIMNATYPSQDPNLSESKKTGYIAKWTIPSFEKNP